MSLKIVFLGCGSIEQNASLFRALICTGLAERGHDVHVLLEDCATNHEWAGRNLHGVEVHYEPAAQLLQFVSHRKALIENLHPEVVHLLGIGLRNVMCVPREKGHTTYIADFDDLHSAKSGPLLRRLAYRMLERRAMRICDASVCVSSYLSAYLAVKTHGTLPSLYLPNACRKDDFYASAGRASEIRKEYGNRKLLVYVGTLSRQYDHDIIIDIAKRMSARKDSLVFVIVGGGPDLERTRKKVSDLGLDDIVSLPGYVVPEDIPAYLAVSDALLFPIRDNAPNRARSPIKVFQYMAAGRPIVTNRVGEVTTHLGDNACYFEFGDPADFERAIDAALDAGPVADKSLVLASHTWDRRAVEYDEWLRDFIGVEPQD